MLRFIRNGVSVFAALFMLAACGGGGGGSAGGPITVSGAVVDHTNTPVSGATIVLNSDYTGLVTTGTTGTFSFSPVTPPYTLTVKSGTTIMEYRGLTRADPLILADGEVSFATTVTGAVTGAAYPLPSDQLILVGATNGAFALGGANGNTGAYSASLNWTGSATRTTNLTALRLSHSGSTLTGFFDAGTRTGVSLEHGVPQSGLDIALSTPVTSSSTIFNYSFGAYNVGAKGQYIVLMANGARFFATGFTTTSGTSALLPGEGATFMVSGEDADGNRLRSIRTAVAGGTTTMDLPASTVLKNGLPAGGEINLSTTPTLSWQPVSGAEFYVVSLRATGLRYTMILPGSSSTLTIPDYTVLGLPLAGSTTYSWDVSAIAASGLSADSMADPEIGGVIDYMIFQASSLDMYSSASTTFTTAP